MVYIKSWAAFHAAAVALQTAEPERTRYLIKSHPATQSLVLKLTDDRQTIKFRTRSAIILNRFQALNAELLALQAGAPPPAPPTAAKEEAAEPAAAAPQGKAPAAAGGAKQGGASAQGAKQGASGGGGKGKKKKGKK